MSEPHINPSPWFCQLSYAAHLTMLEMYALWLRYQDATPCEIAAVLERDVRAVIQAISRGQRKLRRHPPVIRRGDYVEYVRDILRKDAQMVLQCLRNSEVMGGSPRTTIYDDLGRQVATLSRQVTADDLVEARLKRLFGTRDSGVEG